MKHPFNYMGLLSLPALAALLYFPTGRIDFIGFLGFLAFFRYFWVNPDELFLLTLRRSATAAYIQARLKAGEGVVCFDEFAGLYAGHQVERLGPADDKAAQARNVFDALRAFDGTGVTAIWSQCPDEAGLGLAVSNRLGKAAGFHIIDLTGSRRRSGENGV